MAENTWREILPRRMINHPLYVSAFSAKNIGEPESMRSHVGGQGSQGATTN